MGKHTPGSWFVAYNGEGHCLIVSPPHGIVAELRKTPNDKDNARLIAAAPELLEACKLALGQLAHPLNYDVLDVLEKAIAKAEGKKRGLE